MLLELIHRQRFNLLLAMMALYLISLPTMNQHRFQSHEALQDLLDSFFYALLMIAALYSVDKRRLLLRSAIALVALSIASKAAYVWTAQSPYFIAFHLFNLAFLAVVIYSITAFLFRRRKVDGNMISASLCCYLLLGILWANLYSLTAFLQPTAFLIANDLGADATMHFGAGHSIYPIYYSYVTLSTLGYGDIHPLRPVSQMLSIVEALTGQLYLVVIVARLVGLHIAAGQSEQPPSSNDQ